MATRENTMQGERMKIEAHEHDAKMFVQYGRAYEYMKLAFEEIMTPEGYAELKKKVAKTKRYLLKTAPLAAQMTGGLSEDLFH